MSVIRLFSRDIDGWLFLEETAIIPTKDVERMTERAKVFGYITHVSISDTSA